jgi:DNA polymerase III epsilon subunit-like protein
MSPILFFDYETTGLPDFRQPSDGAQQPHICQLAAMLFDAETERPMSSLNVIVKPKGWTIPGEVAAIHGISQEIAETFGVDEERAIHLFIDLSLRAQLRVAHNITFDDRITRIAMLRFGMTREACEQLESRPKFCTMSASSKVMKMPPTERMVAAGFTKPKPPKLAEAIKFFFNEDLGNAHNALFDVAACARLYFKLISLPEAA